MRQRTISPEFFSSSQVIACSPWARLLFIGLWCLADREGRLRDEPARIKREVFPDDVVDGADLLTELTDNGLIERYEVDNQRYIAVLTFPEHQRPHPHEAGSKLPSREMSRQDVMTSRGGMSEMSVKPSVNSGLRNIKPSERSIDRILPARPHARGAQHIASLLPDALQGFGNG